MEIYLDNSATTRAYPEVAELMTKLMLEDYGNPSALHQKGVEAEQYLRRARETMAKILKAQEKEIYFTSGGTESNNWALMGTAMGMKRMGGHIITTQVEHPAVQAPITFLEEQGFTVTRLGVDREGMVDPEELEQAVTPETILVSVMFVNNEIGTVEPIAELGERIKKKNPNTVFHVDAIQAFGKLSICPKKLNIDLMSVSGHKFHGPKGIGMLYVREKTKIRPLILGGGQQNGMRSGTDNVPGAAGMALAAQMVCDHLEENRAHMYRIREQLVSGLGNMDRVIVHGKQGEQAAPQIVNASFLGVRSEVLLHTLENEGIYVSAGSACSSHKRGGSPTLTAIGASKEERESAVRFSFSEWTTEEEIEKTLEVLNRVVPVLRKFTRK